MSVTIVNMKRSRLVALFLFLTSFADAQTYLGFDRNTYPGDANLKALHEKFSYTGYWLNNPPGEHSNSWVGHRAAVESAGFGFLVLFNGRLYAELKSETNAKRLGVADAKKAIAGAQREGFPAQTILFLDIEQGGRMLPEQQAYIYAWVDGVVAAGFRAGVYCSGQVSPDEQHVITAVDIRDHAGSALPADGGRSARATQARATQGQATREITFWVTNDACPPSPGCALTNPPKPTSSGVDFAEIWQFAQSPWRKDVASHCPGYVRGNCNGLPALPVDLNASTSADPSHARLH